MKKGIEMSTGAWRILAIHAGCAGFSGRNTQEPANLPFFWVFTVQSQPQSEGHRVIITNTYIFPQYLCLLATAFLSLPLGQQALYHLFPAVLTFSSLSLALAIHASFTWFGKKFKLKQIR